MKIFIIGGTGVLSTEVVKECLKHRDELYILNRGKHKEDIPEDDNVHLIIGDIRDTEGVVTAINGLQFDIVVDFLSFTQEQLENTFKIFAPLCKQYVFISTCCVFERKKEDGIITEDSPKPNNKMTYGWEKYQCELLIDKLSRHVDSKYTIIRPYITYGDTRIPFGLTPLERYHWTIIGRLLAGKPFFIWDDGLTMCNLLHTRDFSQLLYLLFLNPKAYNQDINITGNVTYKWIDVLTVLYDYFKKDINEVVLIPREKITKILPEYKESLLGDRALDGVFNTNKLIKIVPEAKEIYNNSLSLRDGIIRTIECYKENNYYKGIDFRYDARIDRLLSKSLPYGDKRRRKIKFIDYLGNSTRRDCFIYLFFRYAPNWMVTFLTRIKHLVNSLIKGIL